MGAYAAIEDLSTYGIGADALKDVDPGILQAAIDSCNAQVDGYLATQFDLPLTAWGKDLVLQVCKMAAFEALRMRGFAPEGIDQSIRDGYTDALDWCKGVAAGKIFPNVTDSTPAAAPFVVQPQVDPDLTDSNGNPVLVARASTARGW